MIGKILPILLAVIGLGAGVGAGIALRPDPAEVAMLENPCGDIAHADAHGEGEDHGDKEMAKEEPDEKEEDPSAYDYVKLNNQFVVPIVDDSRVGSLVVLSLSLEITLGQSEAVYRVEPKIRDVFLQVLFDHANAGGFSGSFTKTTRMEDLRTALREAAIGTLGDIVSDVLIVDVVRQDV